MGHYIFRKHGYGKKENQYYFELEKLLLVVPKEGTGFLSTIKVKSLAS